MTLGTTDSEPSVVASSGRLDLFFGYAGTLRHSWRFASGSWQSENLGVAMSLNPAAAPGGPGGLSVMTVTAEGSLHKTSYTSRGWQTSVVGHSGQPSAVGLGAGRIGIAHWGGDGGVVARIYDPSTKWSDQVTLLGSGAMGQPSAQDDNGTLLVFQARRVTTTTAVRQRLAAVTYAKQRRTLPGVDVSSAPTAVTAGSSTTFAVFFRGQGNDMYVVSYSPQSGWGGTTQVVSHYFAG